MGWMDLAGELFTRFAAFRANSKPESSQTENEKDLVCAMKLTDQAIKDVKDGLRPKPLNESFIDTFNEQLLTCKHLKLSSKIWSGLGGGRLWSPKLGNTDNTKPVNEARPMEPRRNKQP